MSKYVALPHGSSHVMLDAAYPTRNMCMLIEKTRQIPVIMPRKGVRVRGFDAMGKRWHRDNPDEFLSIYYKRSNVEATFSSMKRRFSSTLSARKFATQKIELGFFVLCYNIHILAAAV